MNRLTYWLLATVYDGTGENLWAWSGNLERARKRPLAETREWALTILRDLLAQDLVAVGNYEPDGPGRAGWDEWHGAPEAVADRVAEIYTLDVGEDEVPFWPCYLMDTEAGNRLYDQERARREEAGDEVIARLDGIWDADADVIEPNGDKVVL
ncbi:hypothetical protein ACIPEQ_07520 [Curtobacterium sp. NPDC087080]|uniref:hypothetical protein n=1 Tax=Curtobacterium sp. NPDC087080 TaxID=3363965 RepID=UPI0038306CE4